MPRMEDMGAQSIAHPPASEPVPEAVASERGPRLRVVKPPEPGMMDRALAIQLLREYYADEPTAASRES